MFGISSGILNLILVFTLALFLNEEVESQSVDSINFSLVDKDYLFFWNNDEQQFVQPVRIKCQFKNRTSTDIIVSSPTCDNAANPYLLKKDSTVFTAYFVSPLGTSYQCKMDTVRIRVGESVIFYVDLSDVLKPLQDNFFQENNLKIYKIAMQYDFAITEEMDKKNGLDKDRPQEVLDFINAFNRIKTPWTNTISVLITTQKKKPKIRRRIFKEERQ